MMDKKSPYRFTIRFNPNIPEQNAASDLLNNRPDKASYLANALLYYEKINNSVKKNTPTLMDIYAELQEIKQLLQTNPAQPIFNTVSSNNTKAKPTEIDKTGEDLLKNMIGAFSK